MILYECIIIRSGWGVQHYVIKCVSDLRQVDYIKHILLLNIITIGLDTNYNNLQGSSPHNNSKIQYTTL